MCQTPYTHQIIPNSYIVICQFGEIRIICESKKQRKKLVVRVVFRTQSVKHIRRPNLASLRVPSRRIRLWGYSPPHKMSDCIAGKKLCLQTLHPATLMYNKPSNSVSQDFNVQVSLWHSFNGPNILSQQLLEDVQEMPSELYGGETPPPHISCFPHIDDACCYLLSL